MKPRISPFAPAKGRQLRRPGLTLMELVVVMAILAALAAIVIPLFPNLLRRAHKATDCTQTNEMSKSVQLFNALYYSYPDGFDTLTDGTNFPAYLPWDKTVGATSATAPFGGFVKLDVLSAAEVNALNTVGIVNAAPLTSVSTGAYFHPTMWPYADPPAPGSAPLTTPINTTDKYAILDTSAGAGLATNNPRFLANIIAADPNARFIVFGVGPKCSMVNRNIQDAPTSVPQKADFTPDNTYSRVGVIFQISGAAVDSGDGRAIFVCACALEDDELESTEKDIVGYYQVARKPGT